MSTPYTHTQAGLSSHVDSLSQASSSSTHDRTGFSDRGSSSGSGARDAWLLGLRDGHQTPPPQSLDGSMVGTSSGQERLNGSSVKRSRQRSSGGFLLDSAYSPSRLSRTLLSRSHKSSREAKGKRKNDEPELFVAKRRPKEGNEAHRPSIGSSPLAAEIRYNGQLEDSNPAKEVGDYSDQHLPVSSQRASKMHFEPRHVSNTTTGATQSPRFSVGTDFTDVVNMALKLSEARRRQVSGVRVASGAVGGHQLPNGQLATGGSLSQYLKPHRETSRNVSPVPLSQSPKGNANAWPTSNLAEPQTLVDGEGEEHIELTFSEATVRRVQTAKTFFELAYEHRRLLPHLPPLRAPVGQRRSGGQAAQSKTYNPLQYVRNRKLRFREKCPIPAEQEGWHDVLQVRAWVDAVIAAHTGPRDNPDECVRLPDLASGRPVHIEGDGDDVNSNPSVQGSRRGSARPQDMKVQRPRSDWKFHPGDLVADAHWLEQGLNKTKIEDREGNSIYHPDTHFNFTGWRNRTPMHVPDGLQQPTPPPELRPDGEKDESEVQSAKRELPTFTPTNHERKPRGRWGDQTHKPLTGSSRDDSSSRNRHAKLFHFENSSSSASSSDVDLGERRGRKRMSRRHVGSHERQRVRRMETATTFNDSLKAAESDNSPSHSRSNRSSKRGSLENSRINKLFTRQSTKVRTPLRQSQSRSQSARRGIARPRISLDSERGPRSSAEYDTTAPNSPNGDATFPSIAINLSPPHSRSPSPTKRSSLPARLNPFRDKSKIREGVETSDFALQPSNRDMRNHDVDPENGEDNSPSTSRGTSPTHRGVSPGTMQRNMNDGAGGDETAVNDHRGSTVSRVSTSSRVSTKSTTEGSHRVRGMFKGGRIAELVGNEVSRVGDFIWKRDPPGAYKARMSTSTASLPSHHGSDTDGEENVNGRVLDTSSSGQHRRGPSHESIRNDPFSPGATKSSASSADRAQYHNPNLPSFTSPFQKDREKEDDKKRGLLSPVGSSGDEDHISRIATEHRSRSNAPRFDRLAPPKLDTSRPSATPNVDHRNSYGFGSNRDLSRSRNASQIFNSAISGIPEGMPTTGLAGIKASHSRTDLDGVRRGSHQSLIEPQTRKITHGDIARARAALVSTTVKAREIARRADVIRDPGPKFLLDAMGRSSDGSNLSQQLRIRRREEHVTAARNLMATLSSQERAFEGSLQDFRTKKTPNLHAQLQMMEDMVEKTLTPRVRTAADEAGELSMKLATTSTLAVRDVNDKIGEALRMRRHGPVRWLRNLGYKLIELGVVALLWGIWFVVTFSRVVLSMFSGLGRAIRWLLWLS